MNKIVETIIERGLLVIGSVLLGCVISNKISEHEMTKYHEDLRLNLIHTRLDEINQKLDDIKRK